MAPMEIALTAGSGPAGMARSPSRTCRRDGPEQPSGIQTVRLIGNCETRAFGMDARLVGRNFQFQPAAPEGLIIDLLVSSNVPPARSVKLTVMLILVAMVIRVIGAIAKAGTIEM